MDELRRDEPEHCAECGTLVTPQTLGGRCELCGAPFCRGCADGERVCAACVEHLVTTGDE